MFFTKPNFSKSFWSKKHFHTLELPKNPLPLLSNFWIPLPKSRFVDKLYMSDRDAWTSIQKYFS